MGFEFVGNEKAAVVKFHLDGGDALVSSAVVVGAGLRFGFLVESDLGAVHSALTRLAVPSALVQLHRVSVGIVGRKRVSVVVAVRRILLRDREEVGGRVEVLPHVQGRLGAPLHFRVALQLQSQGVGHAVDFALVVHAHLVGPGVLEAA